MEAFLFYLRLGKRGKISNNIVKHECSFISFIFVQVLSNIGIILIFQAEEAQRKLKRQNREDTGISLWEKMGEEGSTYKLCIALALRLASCSWASQKLVENVAISLKSPWLYTEIRYIMEPAFWTAYSFGFSLTCKPCWMIQPVICNTVYQATVYCLGLSC